MLVGGEDAPVEREWATRRRALDLSASWEELARDLDLAGWAAWPRRFDAIEAVRRGLAVGEPAEPDVAAAVLGALEDEHPSVRAAALGAVQFLGEHAVLDAELAESLAADRLPAVREALARALERVPCEAAPRILSRLSLDTDQRVAEVATTGLFVLGAAAAEEQLSALLDRADSGNDAGLLDALRLWMRAGGKRSVLRGLEAWCDNAPPERGRSWRAVARALDYRLFGSTDPTPIFEGWLGLGVWEPRRQELLVASGRGEGMELGPGFLEALDLVASLERGEDVLGHLPFFAQDVRERVRDGRDIELFHLRFDLLDAMEAHLGAEGVAARLHAPGRDPATIAFLLPELGLRLDRWDSERDRAWLDPGLPRELRLAATEGFANTLSRTGDAAAHALLTGALADPDPIVVRVAFRTLSEVESPSPPLGPLLLAWRRATEDERSLMLPWLPRGRPLEPFRADLLALACCTGPLRSLAIELLSTFHGDADVERALSGWLEGALTMLDAAREEELRDASLSVVGLLRALRAVAGGAPPELTLEALERSLGRSTDVGKTSVAFLAETDQFERLAPFLRDDVDSRTRIEAAIGLARRSGGELLDRSVARLLADIDIAARDLRVRMISALGSAARASEQAAAFLIEIAVDPTRDGNDRRRALEALVRAGRLEPVRSVAGGGLDVDTRLVAVRLLAETPGEDLAPFLARLSSERLLEEDRIRLRIEALSSLAEGGRLPEELYPELLRAPREAAAETLHRRFAGARVPEASFSWRGELQAVEHLAGDGLLAHVLHAPDAYRLDAPLLLALAQAALRGEAWEEAWTLHRAALIAGEGDPRPAEGKLAAARCRLLGLAWKTGRWNEAEWLARDLVGAWRRRELPQSVWEDVFGLEDPARGVEPRARLESAERQAAAWGALERGDLAAAAGHAEAAADLLGRSRAAAAEQRSLEAALEAAGR